jgi:hypothetical protein
VGGFLAGGAPGFRGLVSDQDWQAAQVSADTLNKAPKERELEAKRRKLLLEEADDQEGRKR